jgi:hypothetical protein
MSRALHGIERSDRGRYGRGKKHAMHRFVKLINIQRCGYETKQGAGEESTRKLDQTRKERSILRQLSGYAHFT